MKKCSQCKKIKAKTEFYKDKRKPDGLFYSCKKCHLQYYHKNAKHRNEYDNKYKKTPIGKYYRIKEGAKRRDIYIDLSFEQYLTLWGKPCHYCSKELAVTGIDRVDNLGGYTIGNVVPCCRGCNSSKKNHPLEEFLKRIV